jgi:acyl-coenzyme A thioesterase PaaI-like protein
MSLDELLDREPDATTLQLWLERIPYARYLGIQAQVHGKEILFVLPEDKRLIGNPTLPALHGGVVGAFMEQAAALQLIAQMNRPVLPKTIDFSLDYLRPTRLRDTYAQCTITRQGRFVANVAINAWQEHSSEPCAIARAHFLMPESEATD